LAHHYPRCKGNFFDPGELGATFGPLGEPEKWVAFYFANPLNIHFRCISIKKRWVNIKSRAEKEG